MGVPLYLHVTSGGDYSLDVGGGGLIARDPLPVLPLDMVLSPVVSEVAAYEAFGQRVDGMLSLANTGRLSLSVTLDARASDTDWTAELGRPTVDVPAGATWMYR